MRDDFDRGADLLRSAWYHLNQRAWAVLADPEELRDLQMAMQILISCERQLA